MNRHLRFINGISVIFVFLVIGLYLCNPAVAQENKATNPKVKFETSLGDILIELNHSAAPKTVDNFINYVQSGFYDNTIFHRVIKSFMIQGGGFTPEMQQKETRSPVGNEADNGLKNDVGTIAMARTNDPHSATAQFFINVKDNSPLNHRDKTPRGWGYCVFGRVVEGMPVVHAIENVQTGNKLGKTQTGAKVAYSDVPVQPVILKKATIVPAKLEK